MCCSKKLQLTILRLISNFLLKLCIELKIYYGGCLTINYRITGEAGNRIRDTCVPSFSCGSHGGMWTNASMPTTVGEYRTVPLYGSWQGNCSW